MSPRELLAKVTRRRMIEIFVRHRYFYNQGNNTLAQLSVIPIEKIAIIAAAVKYLLGEHISSTVIYTAAGAYLVYRVLIRWGIGWLWHRSDGYDIESEWNKGKVPPSRVEVINWEDGLKVHQVWARKLYEDIKQKHQVGGPFETFRASSAWPPNHEDDPAFLPVKKKPDWVHPDDGWRPEPNSGPREKLE